VTLFGLLLTPVFYVWVLSLANLIKPQPSKKPDNHTGTEL